MNRKQKFESLKEMLSVDKYTKGEYPSQREIYHGINLALNVSRQSISSSKRMIIREEIMSNLTNYYKNEIKEVKSEIVWLNTLLG
tara:strand:+ start:1114 stop:1368 length:255 start_codon:yes stop_codon:yes gene_type:complete